MRFLKIITILIGLFCFSMLSYLVYMIFTEKNSRGTPLLAYVYVTLTFTFTILNLVYHGKSYRFYRKKENVNVTKKLPKVFWAAAISFNGLLLFLFGLIIYETIRFLRYSYEQNSEQITVILLLLAFSTIGFLEVSLLKKRIKAIRQERETKDGIESIGNSTI